MSLSKVIKYLEKIEEEVENLKRFHGEKVTIAYRGENKDYKETRLTPSLFRQVYSDIKERQLLESIIDLKEESKQLTWIDCAIEAQHYYEISKLLDITFNALVGLYFACASTEKNEKSVLYVMAFPEYFSPNSKYVNELYNKHIENQGYELFQGNFKVLSHSKKNERIIRQNGGFILFMDETPESIPSAYYRMIEIEKNEQKEIIEVLEKYFCISKSTLFPEKDKQKDTVVKHAKSLSGKKESIFDSEVQQFFNHKKVKVKQIIENLKIDLVQKEKEIRRILRETEKTVESKKERLKPNINELKYLMSEKSKFENYVYIEIEVLKNGK